MHILRKITILKLAKAGIFLAFGIFLFAGFSVFTARADATGVSISIVPEHANVGSDVRIRWSVTGEPNPQDWIAIFPHNGEFNEYIDWFYTDGEVTGEREIVAPYVPGTYDVRYLNNNTNAQIGQSQTFTVNSTTGVKLTSSTKSTLVGGMVTVYYSVQSPSGSDWIGLYKVGTGNYEYVDWTYTDGENNGSVDFVAPVEAGNYEFRYLVNGSYIQIGNTVSLLVENSTTLPALAVSPNPATIGSQISVGWSGAPGNESDWIGIYKVGVSNGQYESWQYTNGGRTGSINLTVPDEPGNYEVRYFVNNSYVQVGPTIAFVATQGSQSLSLSVVPSVVAVGDAYQVFWSVSSPRDSDWIGVFKVDAPNKNYVDWQYTGAGKSGNLEFIANLEPGQYEVRYFINNSYNQVGSSAFFDVFGTSSNVVLGVSPSVVSPGGSITVDWMANNTTEQDWVGMYEQGDPNTAYLEWSYTEGTTIGEASFTAPDETGNYEFRYFHDNSYIEIGSPVAFRVQ